MTPDNPAYPPTIKVPCGAEHAMCLRISGLVYAEIIHLNYKRDQPCKGLSTLNVV